jgi:hypothetical protein
VAAEAGLRCAWDEIHPYGQQWALFFLDDRPPEEAAAPGMPSTEWLDRAAGVRVRIHHGPDGWPHSLEFLAGATGRDAFRLVGPDVRERFRSDFHDETGWEIHTYGPSGGLETGLDTHPPGIGAGRYSSGHLATGFLDMGSEVTGIAFFSAWVKPDHDARLPAVSLQATNSRCWAGPGRGSTGRTGGSSWRAGCARVATTACGFSSSSRSGLPAGWTRPRW